MIDDGKVFGRSLAFPPRVGTNGQLAWSEGADNVRESIRIILLTEPQERLMRPRFGAGLRRYLFEPNTVETRRQIEEQIRQSLARWEPRIELEAVTVEAHPEEPQVAIATLGYRLVATQSAESLSVGVRLGG